ncbi:MAG: TetR/AcrR family transcriptional regulator [Solirubrobacteraceae bacterium]|nr:TetR/AcrR family transcriptional regulator [Solirubrobacteraceae bacterium]
MDSADRFVTVLQHGRREAILSAFAHTVVDLGYTAVTMDEVARRARLSVGEVRELFPARPDLVAGLIERNTTAARARIEGARRETVGVEPWTERVRVLLTRYLEGMAHDPAYIRLAIVEPAALDDVDPAVKIAMRDAYVTSTLAISREIAADAGLVPLDETTVHFVSAGMGELVARNIYRGMPPAEAMLAIVEPTVRVLELMMPKAPAATPAKVDAS